MSEQQKVAAITAVFAQNREQLHELLVGLVDDPGAALDEAATFFEQMLADSPYLDIPEHPLAAALHICTMHLAVYRALRERGVDAHAWGRVVLEDAARQERKPAAPGETVTIEIPDTGDHPGAFQLEQLQPGEDDDFNWGFNMTSCAICHLFGQHDAMDLVPYMCATDDVISDLRGEGLRRTGTIALGASHCDFRYQAGGDPRRVADDYPEQIRVQNLK